MEHFFSFFFFEWSILNQLCAVVGHFSRVQLFAILWTVACQAPLSMGFPRQEYWSGLSFLPPGDLPDPGIEPASPALAGRFFTTSTTSEVPRAHFKIIKNLMITLPHKENSVAPGKSIITKFSSMGTLD